MVGCAECSEVREAEDCSVVEATGDKVVGCSKGWGVGAKDCAEVGETKDCSVVEATGTEEGPGVGAADSTEVGEAVECSCETSVGCAVVIIELPGD